MFQRLLLTASVILLPALPAHAHLDPVAHGSFAAGFTHPVFGLDHVLVMVAVGLWAFTLGGRALLLVPAAFVATMVLGFGLAVAGLPLPFVEPVIAASVVGLGLLVAMAVRLPVGPGAALVAVFALFHGHAHGGEIGSAGELGYAAGFVLATALLHAGGLLLGWAIGTLLGAGSQTGLRVSRALGAVVAVVGLGILAG
ncbi:protein hupE [Microvirga tunisiensis]|uniref:Protein hupE n=2 Tax=Pannonibacter tanglangensis TaxID=2750084 RepID=A0ABW9ZI56_9HYPH|nr:MULTISPECIES: HupE/UreJ family protein [unclassified Pannonibacter]NBN64383.1 protein hupE [Pannonibacter sp. XCT-34]NBN78917.1 protein hupE [Pannonibacter sp. XCT-53]